MREREKRDKARERGRGGEGRNCSKYCKHIRAVNGSVTIPKLDKKNNE